MAFSHYPEREFWPKLEIELTEEQFASLPYMLPSIDSDGKDVLFECLSKIS
jgi:hypothetical protein